MLVGLCAIDLRIPGVTSLKEKRHVVKSLSSSLRSKFNVSVSEVEHQDLWQRATLGVSTVAGDSGFIRRVMHGVERLVERDGRVELLSATLTLHSPED